MRELIQDRHLLKHPYYQAWECGAVSRESLRRYATDYYHHVSAFPRYVSAVHSQVEGLADRQVLLENLLDEERGDENHPELWMRFCEGLGLTREEVREKGPSDAARALVAHFFACARSSAAEGLGALYAYESQIPEIAEFKIKALKKYYFDADDERSVRFFDVHRVADQYHRQALEAVIEKLPAAERARCEKAARSTAEALWGFLDAMPA